MNMLCSCKAMRPSVRLLCLAQQARTVSSRFGVATIGEKSRLKRHQKPKHEERGARRHFLGMDGSFEENYKMLEEIEDDAEEMREINSRADKHDPVIQRSLSQQERRVQRALVRRKYFRPEPEANLLTWDAKAQMRFLHAEDPDTWTPEQLAASFPISEEGARKVVAQHWQPRSLQEVMRHDERVQRNWLALQEAGGDGGGGPLYSRYQRMFDEGKLHLLGHATGIPSLPQPQQKPLPVSGSVVEPVQGRFTAIVEGYCAQKSGGDSLCKASDLKQLRDTNATLIGSVVKRSLGEEAKAIEAKLKATYAGLKTGAKNAKMLADDAMLQLSDDVDLTSPGRTDGAMVNGERSLRRRGGLRRGLPRLGDTDDVTDEKEFIVDHEIARMRHLRQKSDQRVQLHEFLGLEKDQPKPRRGRGLRLAAGEVHVQENVTREDEEGILSKDDLHNSDRDVLGVQGTGKVPPPPPLRREHTGRKSWIQDNDDDDEQQQQQQQHEVRHADGGKFRRSADEETFFAKVRYQTDGDDVHAYMYEEGKGYSYPFGRKGDVPKDLERAPEQEEMEADMRVYRKNATVYDEDGEFLFKAPR